MKKTHSKIVGVCLVAAAFALLGVVLYEPGNLIAALRLDGLANEGVVVLAALSAICASLAIGVRLFRRSRV